MLEIYDAAYVAGYLGVTKAKVIGWANRPTPAFPLPEISVRSGGGPRQEGPAWTAEQLPLLREWLARRLNLSDPVSHWEAIGRGEKCPGGHQNQEALFDTEGNT